MRHTLIASVILSSLLSSAAYAVVPVVPIQTYNDITNNNASASVTNDNKQGQTQDQGQSQGQGQTQGQSAFAKTDNANNSQQSIIVPASVASANAQGGIGLGTCRFGPGGGFQGPGIGLSASLTIFEDKTCQTLGVADMLIRAGEPGLAVKYMILRDKEVRKASQ